MSSFGSWLYYALVNEFLDEPLEWIVLGIAVAVLFAALTGRPRPGTAAAAVTAPRNRLGKASVVLAVLAFLTAWTGVGGWLLGLAAQITGFLADRRYQRHETTSLRSAWVGILLGFLSVLIGLIFDAIWQDFAKAPL